MPRKVDLPETPTPKPKREISEAQREHLNKIRELAMAKKKELKEITLKSKLAKTVPKQELAKQYDEYVAQKVIQQQKPRPRPERLSGLSQAHAKYSDPEPKIESEESEEETVIVKKSKKKIKKKIIFESESDEETVVVQKKKPPPLEKLVYENTKDQLYQRMIEERVKNSIIGYSHSLGV
jgi:hypothetical protein